MGTLKNCAPEDFLVGQGLDFPLDFHGYVYVIQWGDDGPVKIGRAVYPDLRCKELQVANWVDLKIRALVPLVKMSKVVEQTAHRLAVPHLIRGEWFDLEPLGAVEIILEAVALLGLETEPFHQATARFEEQQRADSALRILGKAESERARMRHRLGMEP